MTTAPAASCGRGRLIPYGIATLLVSLIGFSGMTSSKDARRAALSSAMQRGTGSGASTQQTGSNESLAVVADEGHGEEAASGDALLDAVAAPTARDIDQAQREAAEHVDQLRRFGLATIAPHPFNPPERLHLTEALIALGENIASSGLHQPLVVAPRNRLTEDDPQAAEKLPDSAEWVLIAGHRRWAAAQNAEVTELPGLVRTGPCDPVSIAQVFRDENFLRETPDPIMEAEMYQRMADAGLSTTQVGQRCGVSQGHVSKMQKLLAIRDHSGPAAELRAGRLTRADAFAYLELSPEDQQPVFEVWRADQAANSPKPLRTHALRRTRVRNKPQKTADDTETAEGGSSGTERDSSEGGAQGEVSQTVDTVMAVLEANLTPTIRADMLTDAALHVDEAARKTTPWRALAAQALGIDLPKRGPLDGVKLPQVTRRKLAVARAVVLLDAEAARHATTDIVPPHVERHVNRLRDLGVL